MFASSPPCFAFLYSSSLVRLDSQIALHVLKAGHEGFNGERGLEDAALQYAFVISRLAAPSLPEPPAVLISRGSLVFIVVVLFVFLVGCATSICT